MKSTRIWPIFVFWGAVQIAASPAPAQQSDAGDQASEIVQLFGQGNGVRGVVTALSPGSFVVRTEEGQIVKVLYSANTRMMKDRQPIEKGDIHLGDELIAAGEMDRSAKTLGAVFLYDVDAAEVRKAKEGLGKTWTAGKITSIHDLKITIAMIDSRQPEVIAVDEDTSFRKRGESITLADIKVGDLISARGALKDKTFLAKILRVVEPGNLTQIDSAEDPSSDGSPGGGKSRKNSNASPQIQSQDTTISQF
jgi:hypothetical protein